jgi:hypothetical protein
MSHSGNDAIDDVRHVLSVSTFCRAGQVVYLGVQAS